MIRIADSYFRQLLADENAMEAVSTLAGFWSARADESRPRFGLSEPEYAVQLILIYTGEVGNGGHVQFFVNRGGRYIRDTLDAIHTVGLAEHDAILRTATTVFPGGAALRSAVEDALVRYLGEHQNDILVPERA